MSEHPVQNFARLRQDKVNVPFDVFLDDDSSALADELMARSMPKPKLSGRVDAGLFDQRAPPRALGDIVAKDPIAAAKAIGVTPFTIAPDILGMAQGGINSLANLAFNTATSLITPGPGGMDLKDDMLPFPDSSRISGDPLREFVGLKPLEGLALDSPQFVGEAFSPVAAIAKALSFAAKGIATGFKVAATIFPMFKGQARGSRLIDATEGFTERLSEAKGFLFDWEKVLQKTPDDLIVKDRVAQMRIEIDALEEAGENPFTFYAAKDDQGAQFFADQFSNGVVEKVDLNANNLASLEDVMALKGKDGKRLNPDRLSSVSHLNVAEVVALKKAGFDGAIGEIDRVGGTEIVVFSPDQVSFGSAPSRLPDSGVDSMGRTVASSTGSQDTFELSQQRFLVEEMQKNLAERLASGQATKSAQKNLGVEQRRLAKMESKLTQTAIEGQSPVAAGTGTAPETAL